MVMPSNHLILCHPLLLWSTIFASIKIFSNESVLRIRWPKYWSITCTHLCICVFTNACEDRKRKIKHSNGTRNIHWKNWWWSWNSITLDTWCKEPTHWKRPRCWERLKAGGEGGDRRLDGWMASPTQWTWVWANSGRQWSTGKPGVLQSMGVLRVGHNLATKQQYCLIKLMLKTSWIPCITYLAKFVH